MVINADDRTQTLKKGTSLGQLDPNAEVFVPRSMRAERSAEVDVVCEIINKLPKELTEIQLKEIRQLFRENEAVFSKGEYDIDRTPHVECRIDTGEHRPYRQNLRQHAFAHLDAIDEQVAETTKHGTIEPAASPWASNVVLVRKKDGTLCFCVDYRQLNRINVQDSYPLPLIDNCLNALQGSVWFSTLDLRSGIATYQLPKPIKTRQLLSTEADVIASPVCLLV